VRRLVTALSFVFLCAVHGNAATYYVSLSGNNANSCASAQSQTQANQKRTISAGVACLSPGDTLYIRGGTYTGSGDVIDSQTFTVPSGTSWSNVITIAGYPGEIVTIRPPHNVSGIRLTTGTPHHLVFQDFTIDMVNSQGGADARGIFVDTAHHIRLQRLEVKNSATDGVMITDNSSFNEVLGCKIHDSGAEEAPFPTGHGLYVFGSDNVFDGNEVYDNLLYGFHV
jgi:hypothetical protein